MPPLSLVPPPGPPRSFLQGTALAAFAVFTFGTVFYALGVTAWSGHHVATLEVHRGASAHLPGETVPVQLDPSMNPVRVLAHVDYRPPPSRPLSCRVTLRGPAGRPVWTENRDLAAYALGHNSRRDVGTTLVIEKFAVPRAADYSFAVGFGPGDAGMIHGVRVEVRSRVASVQTWFVYAGTLLALASLAVALVTSPAAKRVAGGRSQAA